MPHKDAMNELKMSLQQDLVGEHQFAGSYDAMKRFVRRLQAAGERPFCRMEVEPGAEAQVDFGLGAWVLVVGKRKRPHLFRIRLFWRSSITCSFDSWIRATNKKRAAFDDALEVIPLVPYGL